MYNVVLQSKYGPWSLRKHKLFEITCSWYTLRAHFPNLSDRTIKNEVISNKLLENSMIIVCVSEMENTMVKY